MLRFKALVTDARPGPRPLRSVRQKLECSGSYAHVLEKENGENLKIKDEKAKKFRLFLNFVTRLYCFSFFFVFVLMKLILPFRKANGRTSCYGFQTFLRA